MHDLLVVLGVSSPDARFIARCMLSLGMFTALAACIAMRRRKLASGSAPPCFTATAISLETLVNAAPRWASALAFLCLMLAHFE